MDISSYCNIVITIGLGFGLLGSLISMLVGYCLGSILSAFKSITH